MQHVWPSEAATIIDAEDIDLMIKNLSKKLKMFGKKAYINNKYISLKNEFEF